MIWCRAQSFNDRVHVIKRKLATSKKVHAYPIVVEEWNKRFQSSYHPFSIMNKRPDDGQICIYPIEVEERYISPPFDLK